MYESAKESKKTLTAEGALRDQSLVKILRFLCTQACLGSCVGGYTPIGRWELLPFDSLIIPAYPAEVNIFLSIYRSPRTCCASYAPVFRDRARKPLKTQGFCGVFRSLRARGKTDPRKRSASTLPLQCADGAQEKYDSEDGCHGHRAGPDHQLTGQLIVAADLLHHDRRGHGHR